MSISLHHADCLDWLANFDGPLFDACVTDPPYHLTSIVKRFGGQGAAPTAKGKGQGATGAYARASRGFMGKQWDGGDIAFRVETWRAVFDALKPGAHLVAFSGTRTYHRMACAIEDAGFEIRDQLGWAYGSGFPKSHDVSKGIDRANGDERPVIGDSPFAARKPNGSAGISSVGLSARPGCTITSAASAASAAWQGWGTALKPAWEPICLARKPLSEKSVAANVLRWGTGAINVDGCRVGTERRVNPPGSTNERIAMGDGWRPDAQPTECEGRWPANLLHDGSDEVLAGFPETSSGKLEAHHTRSKDKKVNCYGDWKDGAGSTFAGQESIGDSGSAARFFYSAKAGPLDRIGSKHATVKPVDLMRWLVRLVTPPGGHVLDPFGGSGTTGIACMAEQFDCTLIELEAEHHADIERKLAYLRGEGRLTFIEHDRRAAHGESTADHGPLFGFPA